MKNKKLLKTVLCVTSGIGFATSIQFLTTSCGPSSIKTNILPYEVYKYNPNDSTILTGFTDEFLADTAKYEQYDTMQIPASVITIDYGAFYNNSTSATTIPTFVTKLTFADGSKCSLIDNGAFYKGSSLTSVTFHSGLITIANSAFSGCTELTSINLSNSINLLSIDGYAFQMCEKLTSVNFPSSLESIGEYAFYNCPSLTSVSFPSSLTTILSNVFDGCSNLSSITWDVWQGATTLDSLAFSGVCPTGGTVTVTNPIDGQHNSDALFQYLKTNGGLPSTWGSLNANYQSLNLM